MGENASDQEAENEIMQAINKRIDFVQKKSNSLFGGILNFWYRLFPYYNEYQEVEHECQIERLQFEPLFIKPGKDLYTFSFVMELVILVFFVLVYN